MSSLADELLGFSDDSDDQPDETEPSASASTSTSTAGLMLPPSTLPAKRKMLEDQLDMVKKEEVDDDEMEGLLAVPDGGVRPMDELDQEAVERMQLGLVDDVQKVAKLLTGKKLEEILKVGFTLFFPSLFHSVD